MKFSIIVLGMNQKDIVPTAIESALNQTYKDIEVIYVDDGSTDGSADYMADRFQSDPRFRMIVQPKNIGTVVSRMDGVDIATGDWVLFVDGDDELTLDACAVLHDAISKAKPSVDMIGFGTNIRFLNGVVSTEKAFIEKILTNRVLNYHAPEEMMERIFLKQEESWNIWNKCYSIALARKMSANIVREKMHMHDDIYLNFVAFHLAKEYLGIDQKLYNYTYGNGVSASRQQLSLSSFLRHLNIAVANKNLLSFATAHGLCEKYAAFFSELEIDTIYSVYTRLCRLPDDDKIAATQALLDTFGVPAVTNALGHRCWETLNEAAKHLKISDVLPVGRDGVRTVGMFYHKLYNGGVERVIHLLTPIFLEAGYNVVLFTDEAPSEDDYFIPDGVPRVVLGACQPTSDLSARSNLWNEAIAQYHVDAVVYHAWACPFTFLDLMSVKNTGAAFLIHSHSVFFAELMYGLNIPERICNVIRHADTFIALSDNDRLFWSTYTDKIVTVKNPLTFDPRVTPQAPLDNKNIVWVGRFTGSKNPLDTVPIMEKVCSRIPDAKLYVVGGGEEAILQQLEADIQSAGLGNNIVLTGFTKDVGQYLRNASLFLSTTSFEGFYLVFIEALAFGLPVITYELPYLSHIAESEATVQVPWKDTDAAADALVALLSDDNRRRELGNLGKAEILRFADYDYVSTWKSILEQSVSRAQPAPISVDAKAFRIFQQTTQLLMKQFSYELTSPRFKRGINEPGVRYVMEYSELSQLKRWLFYLLFDRNTLKSLIRFKLAGNPVTAKLLSLLGKHPDAE